MYHRVLKLHDNVLLYNYIIIKETGILHIVQLLQIFHRKKHDMLKYLSKRPDGFKTGHCILRAGANVFINQSRTVDSGWSSDFCVGRRSNGLSSYKRAFPISSLESNEEFL
jgi:hypothetical protein